MAFNTHFVGRIFSSSVHTAVTVLCVLIILKLSGPNLTHFEPGPTISKIVRNILGSFLILGES